MSQKRTSKTSKDIREWMKYLREAGTIKYGHRKRNKSRKRNE